MALPGGRYNLPQLGWNRVRDIRERVRIVARRRAGPPNTKYPNDRILRMMLFSVGENPPYTFNTRRKQAYWRNVWRASFWPVSWALRRYTQTTWARTIQQDTLARGFRPVPVRATREKPIQKFNALFKCHNSRNGKFMACGRRNTLLQVNMRNIARILGVSALDVARTVNPYVNFRGTRVAGATALQVVDYWLTNS